MNAHELLEINDRFIAFETIMRGGLKEELEKAKIALDNLKLGKDLATTRNLLEAAKQEFGVYKERVEKEFEQAQKAQDERDAALDKWDKELQEAMKEVRASREDLVNKTDLLSKQQYDHDEHKKLVAKQHKERDAELSEREAQVLTKHSDLAAKEAALQHKLDVLKNI